MNRLNGFVPALFWLLVGSAWQQADAFEGSVGQIKDLHGQVVSLQAGHPRAAQIGDQVAVGEMVSTGEDSGVGITFDDHTMISAGPGSQIRIDSFRFDATTREGAFQATLISGTIIVETGEIAAQNPNAMGIVIPSKGTFHGTRKFLVRTGNGSSVLSGSIPLPDVKLKDLKLPDIVR